MTTTEIFCDQKTCEIAKSFLNGTLKELMSALAAECGSLFVFDPQDEELVLSTFYNPRNIQVSEARSDNGRGISKTLGYLRQPVLVEDITTDSRFRSNGFAHYRTGSFISIPLVIGGSLFGLMTVADKASGEKFTQKEFNFAVTLNKYACVIIENLLVSSRIRKEKELLSREKSLLEKYASVGKLASGIVHEINSPLDGVIRFTNILLRSIEHASIAREYLTEIKKGLRRIENITKSLRTFGSQFSRPVSASGASVSVNQLIDEALDIFRGRIRKNIRIEKNYCQDLPAVCDVGLQQVFANMIKNAFDAMPHGGSLYIRTAYENGQVRIAFKDSGYGIPAQVQDHIFEPFFTTKGAEEGSGLGLSICKEIVSSCGGSIEVRSCAGEGAEFIVGIPG